MPLTLEDIAQMSGYSRSTVSRVINGDINVSDKTREKIMEVIRKYDFQPNLAARGLAVGHTRVLGLVIPKGVSAIFEEPFFALLIQGVSSRCNALDYSVMLWLAEPDYERRMINKILYNGLADGVIVASMLENDSIIDSLRQNGLLPFVLIGRHPVYDQISYLDVDNRSGAREAVLYLLQQGRRRIATLAGPQNMTGGSNRYLGYLDALNQHGLPLDPDLVAETDFSDAGGYLGMQRLLAHKPDAIFAASDTLALAAIRAIRESGLRIPEDIAVIGFDDIPQASRSIPALSTVRQPISRLGALAAETLIEMIENTIEEPRQVILPAELVLRDSC